MPAIFPEFADSFIDMVQWNALYLCGPGEEVFYPRPPTVSLHDVARNKLVEWMRGDWLLMLDSDHSFEPDLCGRLVEVHKRTGADVVVGVYQYRNPPHPPVLFCHKGSEEDGTAGLYPIGAWDGSLSAIEVDSAGAGCLWVRRAVFDRIEAELREEPFARIKGYGEDHSFFLRLRKLGIKAVCDPRVECHHLQVRPLAMKDYDRDAVTLDDPIPATGYR